MTTEKTGLCLAFLLPLLIAVLACGPDVPEDIAPEAPPLGEEVTVSGGTLLGSRVEEAQEVLAFKGIPYAAPPVGDLRWRPPQPAPAWEGTREAAEFSDACWQPQRDPDAFYGGPPLERSEDCLYLNVWTAAERTDERRPVMVWIHGGGLVTGTGSTAWYDGTELARKGVVVVTINYRLGPLGFLAHASLSAEDEHGSSGNYGILDQVLALNWVEDNIAAFGGDPANVTIFGESAGSWSVCYLQATPLAAGLVHRVIGQSGGVFDLMPDLEAAEERGARFAEALGFEGEAATATALREKTPDEIYEAYAEAAGPGRILFRPNVDGWAFPQQVYSIFAAGEQHDVPVIVGSNADEATALWGGTAPTTVADYRERVERQFGDFADEILAAYPAASDAEAKDAYLTLMAHDTFTWQMRTWGRMMENVASPAYLYYFSRVPPGPESETYGSYHAAEIVYVFDNLEKGKPHLWGERDHELADLMSAYWTNFAAQGDPNGEGLPGWPRYDAPSDQALELGDTTGVVVGLEQERLDLLDRYQAAQRAEAAGTLTRR